MIIKPIWTFIGQLPKNFINLIYPRSCCACATLLLEHETHLCMACRVLLPRTRFHLHKENQLTKIFWGRLRLETGTSLYYFQKGGKVQRLIHQFKYRGNTPLGFYLGELLGKGIGSSGLYDGLHFVIPVPLHPKKERSRGFNQSEVISRGIAGALSIPCRSDLLVRTEETATQTRKSRFDRWQNVSSVFETPIVTTLENRCVLLVDDVITTGATLEACAQKLLAVKGVRVWIATLAITA